MNLAYDSFFLGFIIGGLLSWGWGQRRLAKLHEEVWELLSHEGAAAPERGPK